MATKKKRKKTSKKVSKTKKKEVKSVKTRSSKKKILLVLKNLILFAVLTLASVLLYVFSNKEIFRNLFQLLAIVLGFVGLAFLIVLFVLLLLKGMKK
jgi:hypothetical protein